MIAWLVIIGLVVLAAAAFVTVRAQNAADIGKSNTKILNTLRASSERRDCVTTISTARRSVFDNVDIFKAIQVDQLSTALLNAQAGNRASPEVIQAFQDNAAKLHAALDEARRLQPAKTLDDLIAKGGMVDGVHYDACPD